MSIGAGIRRDLGRINKRTKELIDEGFPPYIAYGKASDEETSRMHGEAKAEVSQLPDSWFKRILNGFLKVF